MFCHKSFSFRVDCNKGRSASRRKLPPPVGATPLPTEATSLQCKVTTIIHFLPLRVYFYESNSITESFAMIPDASICGFIFAHPEASYPDILRLRGKSIEAYAVRRGLPSALAHSIMSHLGEGEQACCQ